MRPHAAIRRITVAMVVSVSLGLFCSHSAAQSQPSITVRVDTQQVHIGDPIRLQIRIDGLEPQQRALFPATLQDQWPEHVLARRLDRVTPVAGTALYDVRLFEVGETTLEALSITVVDGADTLILHSPPLQISVVAVREEGEQDLRLIKPPWMIAGGIPIWLVAVVGTIVILLVAWAAYRLFGRHPHKEAPRVEPPTDYRREFSRIEKMGLLERGAIKLFYTHLSEILRRFLEERLEVDALERTTHEIDVDLAEHPHVEDPLRQQILTFLQAADLVKFARAEPTMQQSQVMPASGRNLVEAVEALLARTRMQEESNPTPEADSNATAGVGSAPSTVVEVDR